MMKEYPILFTGEMVRATLEDRKTQTRRVMKPQPDYTLYDNPLWRVKCPYGVSGDHLWVKETWTASKGGQQPTGGHQVWMDKPGPPDSVWYQATSNVTPPRWCSPIFMPRWASRITLENKSVQIQRVQDISQKDAKAEGVTPIMKDTSAQAPGGYWYEEPDFVEAFAELWDSINAKPKPAKRNPYTWKRELCYVSYPWENVRETR